MNRICPVMFTCPKCGGQTKGHVKDTSGTRSNTCIRRSRVCDKCDFRFDTVETIIGVDKDKEVLSSFVAISKKMGELEAQINLTKRKVFS